MGKSLVKSKRNNLKGRLIMKKTHREFKILEVRRGKNSYYGNPSWFLILADSKGNIYEAKTASNAAIGYVVSSSWVGQFKTLEYHFTAKGTMIIDYSFVY